MENTGLKIGVGLLVFLLLGGMMAWNVHNALIEKQEDMKLANNNLNTELQNRKELIPSMISVAEASLKAQKEIPIEYAQAREGLLAANADYQAATADKNNTDTVKALEAYASAKSNYAALNIRAESVPEFKTDQLTELNNQMAAMQNAITYQRQNYNTAVREYNLIGQKFPGSMFAGMYGFEVQEGFKADAGAEKMPDVNISF